VGTANICVVRQFIDFKFKDLNFVIFMRRKTVFSKKSCFTILEMLIVISIIGILTVSIIINKQSNQGREDLLNAVKTTALDIREVQNFTMNSSLAYGRIPCGYGIHFYKNTNASGYLSFYEAMVAQGSVCSTDKKIGSEDPLKVISSTMKTVKFDLQNIEIDNIRVDGSAFLMSDLFFAPPDPIFYIDGSTGKKVEITLKVKGKTCPSDFCKSIIVNQLGQVSIE